MIQVSHEKYVSCNVSSLARLAILKLPNIARSMIGSSSVSFEFIHYTKTCSTSLMGFAIFQINVLIFYLAIENA